MKSSILGRVLLFIEVTSLCFLQACISSSSSGSLSDELVPELNTSEAIEQPGLEGDSSLSVEAPAAGKEASSAALADPEIEVVESDVDDYAITDHSSFDPTDITIHFEFNKSELTPQGIQALDKITVGMKKDPLAFMDIRGHADKQGTERYNLTLSAKRAEVIRRYLIGKGIDAERLSSEHLGSSEPVDTANRVSAFKKNRRGEFTVNYGPSSFGR